MQHKISKTEGKAKFDCDDSLVAVDVGYVVN